MNDRFKPNLILFITTIFFTFYFLFYLGNFRIGYPIFGFLTQLGKFDDFFNNYHFGKILPSYDESYVLSPFLIAFFKFIPSKLKMLQFILFTFFSLFLFFKTLKFYKMKKIYILLFFLSYPILFSVSRGNAELLSSAILFYSLVLYINSDITKSYKYFLISCLIKPTTILFIFIFKPNIIFSNMRINFIFIFINLISIILIEFNIVLYIDKYFAMLSNYKDAYVIGGGGTLFNNSFYGLFKWYTVNVEFFNMTIHDAISTSKVLSSEVVNNTIEYISLKLKTYSSWSIYVIGFSSILCLLSKNFYHKILIISLTSILFFSPIACDYRLIYMLILIMIIIKNSHNFEMTSFEKYSYLLLLFIIIIPKHFISFWILSPSEFVPMTLNSLINPILLSLLLFLAFLRTIKNMIVLKKFNN